jgi:S-adenosyl-L-methionine hydrolase (adenosine-forming)
LQDPYVAEMKAIILGICPKAVIVDISHEVEKFDIRMGAYILASTSSYFPKGTVHVAVVDPEVGTSRRCLIVQTKRSFFVGPDNGVLILAAEKEGIVGAYEIASPKYMLSRVSSTFQGRDVFAPAAAHLCEGVNPVDFGAIIKDFVKPKFSKVKFRKGKVVGEVLHVDRFGNIVTNIREESLSCLKVKDFARVNINQRETKLKLGKSYAEAKLNESLVLVGSQGYIEIAKYKGNASEEFNAKPSDKITLSF